MADPPIVRTGRTRLEYVVSDISEQDPQAQQRPPDELYCDTEDRRSLAMKQFEQDVSGLRFPDSYAHTSHSSPSPFTLLDTLPAPSKSLFSRILRHSTDPSDSNANRDWVVIVSDDPAKLPHPKDTHMTTPKQISGRACFFFIERNGPSNQQGAETLQTCLQYMCERVPDFDHLSDQTNAALAEQAMLTSIGRSRYSYEDRIQNIADTLELREDGVAVSFSFLGRRVQVTKEEHLLSFTALDENSIMIPPFALELENKVEFHASPRASEKTKRATWRLGFWLRYLLDDRAPPDLDIAYYIQTLREMFMDPIYRGSGDPAYCHTSALPLISIQPLPESFVITSTCSPGLAPINIVPSQAALVRCLERLFTVYYNTANWTTAWESMSHRANVEFDTFDLQRPLADSCITLAQRASHIRLCTACLRTTQCGKLLRTLRGPLCLCCLPLLGFQENQVESLKTIDMEFDKLQFDKLQLSRSQPSDSQRVQKAEIDNKLRKLDESRANVMPSGRTRDYQAEGLSIAVFNVCETCKEKQRKVIAGQQRRTPLLSNTNVFLV